MATGVVQVEKGRFGEIKKRLKREGFGFEKKEHAVFCARKGGVVVTLYKTGRLVIQGKTPDRFPDIQVARGKTVERIGTDEAGKGDYFGYLVVGAVYVNGNNEDYLKSLGVRDSKRIGDKEIKKLAGEIRDSSIYSIVAISPERYNRLYKRLRNLNELLAWAHARAIENILERRKCGLVVSDQFGDKRFLKNRLMEKGRGVKLIQRPRAEDDVAVAAASIIARDHYLKTLDRLSEKYKVRLPRGSTNVLKIGRKLANMHGVRVLDKTAKTHFKTTREIIR